PYTGAEGGNEEYYMNLIADAMEPYLYATGIEFVRNDPSGTVNDSVAKSNMDRYDLHLALHSNASPENIAGTLKGSDFYYYTRSLEGKEAAATLADNFQNIYPDPSRVRIMPTSNLAELSRTNAPAVLVEIAYHDNPEDADWIRNNINEIARNLVQGLAEHFGILFVTPNEGYDYSIGVVVTEEGRLNIRERPTTNSNVLTQAPKGSEVRVFGRSGNWYVVEYNGILGFAFAPYVAVR
ncbi:MAG: peptidoglycan hydrolase, partial [Ruminococcaceae bacterium]|nr:peptidoglycan hydrolase [Oscillospiraceae bacterium]